MPKIIPEYIGKPPEAVRAFQVHRSNALRRGIPFLFTFAEWWAWWQTDARWDNRGVGKDKLVMARKGDEGPYSPQNVYCATQSQNMKDLDPDKLQRSLEAAWSANRASSHLRQRGAGHPRSRPVETPAGTFGSAALAAEHHGITRQHAARLAREGQSGWKWAE